MILLKIAPGLVAVAASFASVAVRSAAETRGSATSPASAICSASTPGRDHGLELEYRGQKFAASCPRLRAETSAVKVNVDMTGARMQTRLMLSLAAGVGAPDVSQFELTDAPRYIATGRLTDLTPVAAKYKTRFPASLWDNCTLNGRVYAIPWDIGPCAVFYKRDLFRRYGIDPDKIETWDDYIEAGKEILRKSGGRTKMLPLGSNSLRPMFEMLIQQNGGQVFDDQGRIAINSPQTRQALALLQKMRAAGICSDIALWSQEFLAGLNDESIATYPIAIWFAGTIKDTVKDYAGKKAEWGVFRLPAITPGGLRVANLGGSVLVIPEQCQNKAAAWAFVEYALCTNEGQIAQYRNMSLFPAFLPAMQNPDAGRTRPVFRRAAHRAAVRNRCDENHAPEPYARLGRSGPLSGSGTEPLGGERHGKRRLF